jgi:16S rRNA (guanine1207-N2)-methyltransferase
MTPIHPDPAPRALRLALALDAGLSLPEGRIALLHPGGAEVLPDLDAGRLLAVTPHAPDFARLAAQGVAVQAEDPAPDSMAAVLVCLPRGRAEGMDLIARACALTAGPVIVDGQKSDGIEAVLRALKGRVALSEPISKGHGKIAWFPAVPLDDWRAAPVDVTAPDGRVFATVAGVFSADRVDPASALLAEAVPEGVKGVCVDLGAGWGYLSARLLARAPALREM